MKAVYWIAILGIGGVALYSFLKNRKSARAGLTGGEPAFDPNAIAKNVHTEVTDSPILGAGQAPTTPILGAPQASTSERNQKANDALATGQPLGAGLQFISSGKNIFGEPQAIFEISDASKLKTISGVRNEPGFSGFTYLTDSGFKFSPASIGTPKDAQGFVEFLPSGAAAGTAQNVIFTGAASGHPSVSAPAALKPGDPGYEAAVANARAKSGARKSAPATSTSTSTTTAAGFVVGAVSKDKTIAERKVKSGKAIADYFDRITGVKKA